MTPLRRIPFAARDADALIAFCVANGSPHDAALLRRLMLELASDPAGVFVIADEVGPVFVATVVDGGQNAVGAAMLEIVGVGAAVPREAFAELVVAPAVAFGRAGTPRVLHVAMPVAGARIEGAEEVLRAAGFARAFELFTMRRPATAAAPQPPPLPPGWRWQALDDARVAEAHATLAAAFCNSTAFTLSPLPVFRRAVASGATIWRALLDRETLAGVVQVAPHTHAVRTVARRPAYRGQGVGDLLVAEGLRILGAHGPADVELEVEAANERALALYRRFGFEVAVRAPVFALGLRG